MSTHIKKEANIKNSKEPFFIYRMCVFNYQPNVVCLTILCAATLYLFAFKAYPVTKNHIIVAMHIEPPFSDIVDNKFVGENIDIANALAQQVNKKAKFVYCPVARCFSLVQSGQADMIIAIRKTKMREQFLHYLSPPIKIQTLPLRFYIHANNTIELTQYDDLRSLKVGVIRGASYFDKFDHDTQIAKVSLTTHQQMIDMLLKGRIDTFLEREESITPLVDQTMYSTRIKLAEFSYDKSVGSYIAISKKSSLANQVSDFSTALKKLFTNGEMKTITEKTQQEH